MSTEVTNEMELGGKVEQMPSSPDMTALISTEDPESNPQFQIASIGNVNTENILYNTEIGFSQATLAPVEPKLEKKGPSLPDGEEIIRPKVEIISSNLYNPLEIKDGIFSMVHGNMGVEVENIIDSSNSSLQNGDDILSMVKESADLKVEDLEGTFTPILEKDGVITKSEENIESGLENIPSIQRYGSSLSVSSTLAPVEPKLEKKGPSLPDGEEIIRSKAEIISSNLYNPLEIKDGIFSMVHGNMGVEVENIIDSSNSSLQNGDDILSMVKESADLKVEDLEGTFTPILEKDGVITKSEENIESGLENIPSIQRYGSSLSVSSTIVSNDAIQMPLRYDLGSTGTSTNRNLGGKTDSQTSIERGQKQMEDKVSNQSQDKDNTHKHSNQVNIYRALVDTAPTFESVRDAVTKFGGIVDWKAHKMQIIERRKLVEHEVAQSKEEIPMYKKQVEELESDKMKVLRELDDTKKLIRELELNLEKAQLEENQLKQDSELAKLRVTEMEQGIAEDASIAAKTQVDLAKSRYVSALSELEFVKDELVKVQKEYALLVNERDIAVTRAKKTFLESKEMEKMVEDLTLELIVTKDAQKFTHADHLEAEEHRIGAVIAKDQDSLIWERELKQAQEELWRLNNELMHAQELKLKLEASSTLLLQLKSELADYMSANFVEEYGEIQATEENPKKQELERKKTRKNIQEVINSSKKELEEVRSNTEKIKEEVHSLKMIAESLKSELHREIAALSIMKQREGMASIAVSSLEAELNQTILEIELVRLKEEKARAKIVAIPKELQQAALEADQAKAVAQTALEESRRVKAELEKEKAGVSTMQSRLLATLKAIEATKASEILAVNAVKALEESGLSINGTHPESSHNRVTLLLIEYHELSGRALEAEEQANEKIAFAMSQVEEAKQSELRSLERLEAVTKEMNLKKEALKMALETAEKAKEGKLNIEKELRKWRAENEQRRKAISASEVTANIRITPPKNIEEPREGKDQGQGVTLSPQPVWNSKQTSIINNNPLDPNEKHKKKVKRFLFPHMAFLMGKRKGQSVVSGQDHKKKD